MNHQAAEAFLQEYRSTLKTWSMVLGGFASGDSDGLRRSIVEGRTTLDVIGKSFPDLTYAAEMLRTSTEGSAAWFTEERPARPEHRKIR